MAVISIRRVPRDSQRSKLYAAERLLPEIRGKDLGSKPRISDAQAFINRAITNAHVRRHFNLPSTYWVMVEPSYGKSGAHAVGAHKIRCAEYMRNQLVLLHELAHCIHSRQEDMKGKRDAVHGAEYAAIYVQLVQTIMGEEVARRLKAAFKAKRVRFAPKRQMSEEQKAVLRERLAKIRPMKVAATPGPTPVDLRLSIAMARANES